MTWIYDDAAHNTLAGGGAGSAVTAPGREERQKLEHGIILPAVFNKTLFWSSHAFKITHEIAPGLPQLDRNLWSTDFDLINSLDNDITVCKWQVFALEKNICACSLIYLENFLFLQKSIFLENGSLSLANVRKCRIVWWLYLYNASMMRIQTKLKLGGDKKFLGKNSNEMKCQISRISNMNVCRRS